MDKLVWFFIILLFLVVLYIYFKHFHDTFPPKQVPLGGKHKNIKIFEQLKITK